MTHFSDTQLWYPPPSMETQHQHHKSFPFFYPHQSTTTTNHYDNNYEDSDNSTSSNNNPPSESASSLSGSGDRDHMFEKPLTPSDVGKLNRLVIPKQHAERYFPLAGGEKSAGAGGVLLGFEDETGKLWRFRYSYWNSSQSYVLTKGWSRYVKEKKLESGDVVLFERHRFESDRFFIGWRRRRTAPAQTPARPVAQVQLQGYPASHRIAPHPYQPECFHAGTDMIRQRNHHHNDEMIRKAPKSGNSKRLRLFGVNLECQLEEDDQENPGPEPQTSDGSSLSSHEDPGQGSVRGQVGPTAYNYSYDYVGYPPTNHHNQYMAINFPHDVNQTRNRLG